MLGNVHVELQTVDDDGWPTGTVLASAQTAASGLVAYDIFPQEYRYKFEVTFSMTCELAGSTVYAIVIWLDTYDTGYPQNHVQWLALTDWTYSSGRPMRYSQPGFEPTGWNVYPTTTDLQFRVMKPDTVQKVTNPTPANGATAYDFSDWTVSWQGGGSAAQQFQIYMGDSPSNLWLYGVTSSTQTTFTVPEGYLREDLLRIQNVIYWRVNTYGSGTTITGDVWSFDPRPAKVTYVSPVDKAIDQKLHVGAEWEAAAAVETYVFRIIEKDGVLPTVITGLTASELKDIGEYLHLKHHTTYYWRVDTVNQFGTTIGDAMEFRTITFNPPSASWELIVGGSGLGPFDGGIEGVDFRWIGNNSMATVKRVVAVANNRLWYEEV